MKQIITCYLCKIDKYWKKIIFIKNYPLKSNFTKYIFIKFQANYKSIIID